MTISTSENGYNLSLIIDIKTVETLVDRHAQLRQELRQALAAGGYCTKEEIVALVQDVKRELADEGEVNSAGHHST